MKYPGFEGLIDFEKEQDSMSKIINAAIYTFSEKGYVRATTREIAGLAGVSEALVFKYFRNKQRLLDAVSIEIMENRIPVLLRYRLDELMGMNSETLKKDVVGVIQDKFDHIERNIGYFKIIFLDISHNTEDTVKKICARINGIMEELERFISDVQKRGLIRQDISARTMIRSFAGMMNFLLVDRSLLNPELDVETELAYILEIFMNGVVADD